MGWRPRLLCCLFLSLSLAAAARAAAVHQEWDISYQFKSPDCVRKLSAIINIYAAQGDAVEVKVRNWLLTESVAIHWHGIWQMGTEGVTQCLILPGDIFTYAFVVDRAGTYMFHAHYAAGLNGLIVVAAAPDAEPFRYDGDLLNDWWHKSNVLFNVASLSALNFEIQGHNARLISYAKESITVKAVASGSTSSRRPPTGHQQCGAALVAVMLCLFVGEFLVALYLAAGHPVADQNPAADEGTIARSGLDGSAAGSLPVGGGHTPSPSPPSASSPSSTDPTDRNRSSATSTTSGEETVLTEEDHRGPPGSPPQRPVVLPAVHVPDSEGPLFTFVLALLAYDAAAMVAILHEFERIVGTWSTAPEVVYGVLTVVAVALLAVGLMAAGCHAHAHAFPVAGGNSNKQLSVSAFCARLVAILFTFLLVVAFSCKLGRWACVAAVPSAAIVACIMAAVWIWGDEHAVANAVVCTCWGRILDRRRERQPAGVEMV